MEWQVTPATPSERNPQEGIIVNGVAQNGTSVVMPLKLVMLTPLKPVKRDDVAFSCVYAPDGPGGRTPSRAGQAGVDAAVAVAHRGIVPVMSVPILLPWMTTPVGLCTEDYAVSARSYYIARAWRAAADGGIH